MDNRNPRPTSDTSDSPALLTPEAIGMLVASVTGSGSEKISELEAERLLNAIARVQAGVPTGTKSPNQVQ